MSVLVLFFCRAILRSKTPLVETGLGEPHMSSPEQLARINIDTKLRSELLGWKIIRWSDKLDTSTFTAHAALCRLHTGLQ